MSSHRMHLLRSANRSLNCRFVALNCFLLFCWLLFSSITFASQLVLLGNSESISLNESFVYFEDRSGELSIHEILEIDRQGLMPAATRHELMQRNINSRHWLRFDLNNQSNYTHWVIHPTNPQLFIQAFRVNGHNQIEEITDSAPMAFRRFENAEIFLPGNQSTRIYLRASAPYLVDLRVDFIPLEHYYEHEVRELILVVLISGVFLSLIVYNLFLLVSLREIGYFYYVLFALINCHLWLMALRFPNDILTLGGIDWLEFVLSYRSLAPLAAMLFTRNFLRTRDLHPKIDALILLYMGGLLVMVFGFLIDARWEPQWIAIQDTYFMFGILILVFAGFYSLLKGFQPAIYFLLGMGSFIAGNFIYLASGKGLIPANFFTLYGAVIGQAVQLLLMSLALADKIRVIDGERMRYAANSEFKSRLLRQISHDIANPLTVIRGTSHVLETNPKNEKQVSRVLRSADKIHEIMRFVLKTETLEDETQIELMPVPLKEVFDDLQFLFETPASEKNVRIDFRLEETDLRVLAEKTSLTNEVLGNLVSNALKFSNSGGLITVRAAKHPSDSRILIFVEDQGVGMSQTTINSIMQQQKVNSRRGTNGETGYGYGTSIVNTYVRAFRGQLRVTSSTPEQDTGKQGTVWEISLANAAPSKLGFKFGLNTVWSRLRKAH